MKKKEAAKSCKRSRFCLYVNYRHDPSCADAESDSSIIGTWHPWKPSLKKKIVVAQEHVKETPDDQDCCKSRRFKITLDRRS